MAVEMIRKKMKKMNQRGQITIFIILALIIVVGIIILFLLVKPIEVEVLNEDNPQAYIELCTKYIIKDAVDILSKQGGDIIPVGSVTYNGNNITYLCYNSNFYQPCINQRALLINHIENQIYEYSEKRIDNCFQSLKASLEKRYDVEVGDMKLDLRLEPGQVIADINRKFKMKRGENTMEFDNFKASLNNPIYDLSKIAIEIANQESHYCNFDVLGFMIIYPEYDISKFRTGDSDIIYTLKKRNSNQEFVFAIRGCVLPPGF